MKIEKKVLFVLLALVFVVTTSFNYAQEDGVQELVIKPKMKTELSDMEKMLPLEEQDKILMAIKDQRPYVVLMSYANWHAGSGIVLLANGDVNDMSNFFGLGDNLYFVTCNNGARIQVFEHDNWRGNSVVLQNPRNLLGSFERKASSIKWLNTGEGSGPYVKLYEHDTYRGRCLTVYYPIDLNCFKKTLAGYMNDEVSSIKVFNGARIWVFQHTNWKGYYKLINKDVRDLKRDGDSSYHPLADAISALAWLTPTTPSK